MDWQLIKAIFGLLAGLIGLYHWCRLDRDNDAAYRSGNAVMFTIIAYQLLDGS